eukprot:TRINITY_DN6342_c0_g1_i1.p1 TRINITY_DN6342_c0_g1~~TRINITY_DN6342_c0_g1_i1.p1  ORF type:complete len:259 (-),score=47.26 TRINITY_DN6342_c0_g1_i1:287-1063(-)
MSFSTSSSQHPRILYTSRKPQTSSSYVASASSGSTPSSSSSTSSSKTLMTEAEQQSKTDEKRRIRIGIVGTAGRKLSGGKPMTKELFQHMLQAVTETIEGLGSEWNEVHFISGGAAWADHLAVVLFLEKQAAGLKIYIPCKWIGAGEGYHDTGKKDWRTNPGRTANIYHENFSSIVGRNSFIDIDTAQTRGASLDATHPGYHNRNTAIALASDILIALTWSEGNEPTEGGTLDTWKKCTRGKKIHISLPELVKQYNLI